MRCKTCSMPSTRPDHVFVDGVCPACTNRIPEIDWGAREKELLDLLDRHDGRCIVPSSGGKDSTYQVIKLLELGADPLIVTATTCHLTKIGRENIDNLARFATTIEVSPNKTIRRKLNKLGLELVGDISWPEHAAIFSTPFNVAAERKIPLIFFGENPQNQYGGPKGTEESRQMTQRWIQEFGGFLGLRPNDFIGVDGITKADMQDYQVRESDFQPEAHFLGQYIKWDSRKNAKIAKDYGMIQVLPCKANWWAAENQDNAQTGLHDHMMYRKYGYGRGCTQISVDVREGLMTKATADRWVDTNDGLFPYVYAGVDYRDMLEPLGISPGDLFRIIDEYTNWDIFKKLDNDRVELCWPTE